MATELAANAIRHTASGKGGKFGVEIRRLSATVRVAGADGAPRTGLG